MCKLRLCTRRPLDKIHFEDNLAHEEKSAIPALLFSLWCIVVSFDISVWVGAMLKADTHWYRDNTGDAIADLVATSLSSDVQALSKDTEGRQALVEIAAALVAKNVHTALALQERIKLLR